MSKMCSISIYMLTSLSKPTPNFCSYFESLCLSPSKKIAMVPFLGNQSFVFLTTMF